MGLNAIEALQVTKVNKLHELQLAQLAAGVKVLHTPYQLHLLQHREKLDIHCQAIAAAKAIADEKEACEHHEYLFWQWMESVALEELAEKPQSKCSREEPPTVDLIGVTEADLLPAIEHLKLKLTACEQDVEGGTSSSGLSALSESFKRTMSKDDVNPHKENDTSWQYAKNMAVGLLRQPVFVFTPEKKPEIRNHKVALRNKEESDPQSALYKMKKYAQPSKFLSPCFKLREHFELKFTTIPTSVPLKNFFFFFVCVLLHHPQVFNHEVQAHGSERNCDRDSC